MRPIARWVTCVACALFSGTAQADPFWLYDRNATTPQMPGQLYIGPVIAGGVQQLPRFRSPVAIFTSGAVGATPVEQATRFETNVFGVEPGGVLGYVFRDGSVPAWLGQRFRIELSGHAIAMEGDARATRAPTGSTYGGFISGVSGTTLISAAFAGDLVFTEDLKFHREGFRLRLRAAGDRVLGPNLVLTPAISIIGGQTRDTYQLHYFFTRPNGTFEAPGGLHERIRTNEIGLDLSATAVWHFHPGFALLFGGNVGVVWMRSHLDGQDCFAPGGNAVLGIGTPCGLGNPAFVGGATSVSTSRSAAGFRGGAALGLSTDLRFGIMTLTGFFRYDSHIPTANNFQASVRAPASAGFGPIPGGNPAATIGFESGFAYGGMLRLVIPIRGLAL